MSKLQAFLSWHSKARLDFLVGTSRDFQRKTVHHSIHRKNMHAFEGGDPCLMVLSMLGLSSQELAECVRAPALTKPSPSDNHLWSSPSPQKKNTYSRSVNVGTPWKSIWHKLLPKNQFWVMIWLAENCYHICFYICLPHVLFIHRLADLSFL